jgi:hypothetical protein
MTSLDGINWVQHSTEIGYQIFGIAFGNGQFVAVSDEGVSNGVNVDRLARILTSIDGVNWEKRFASNQYALLGISYAGGQFVAAGYTVPDGDAVIVTSGDGVNWVRRQTLQRFGLSGITFGNGHFVALGNPMLVSGSIIGLTLTPNPDTRSLTLSLTGPTGLAYTIETSTNLISWRNLSNFAGLRLTNVIFNALPTASDNVFYRAYSR